MTGTALIKAGTSMQDAPSEAFAKPLTKRARHFKHFEIASWTSFRTALVQRELPSLLSLRIDLLFGWNSRCHHKQRHRCGNAPLAGMC
jgi:hypothetical protein